MKNVNITMSGNIMTITLDITKNYGPSASGKTEIIASTEGNQNVDGVTIGLNVYKKAGDKSRTPAKHTQDAKALAKDMKAFADA